ncbi:MAG: acyl-CoA synthetase FdrA [Candidatus Eisenbacteria bacterium]|nr:acyl-CoA synthetase FdrA [Candidatus Eisenbacteria bacterium]
MILKTVIRSGAYADSVTLMKAARELSGMPGVDDAAVIMGTEENKAILRASGLLDESLESAGPTDMLVAVRAADGEAAAGALSAVDELLTGQRGGPDRESSRAPRSLETALAAHPELNLALISVAGRYAGGLAWEALERDLHVMIFSDNVPLETEVALKREAHEKGLIVMGPDCGTAIVNGAPLGFANVVSRGPVGIVAASGTGLQEVSCLLSESGAGISQAIGTGSRDVSDDVGGITFLDAIDALGCDADTQVIVLVSKPPDPSVHERIRRATGALDKPVVSVFLGTEPEGPYDARTLAEAAAKASDVALGGEAGADSGRGTLSRPKADERRERARGLASSVSAGRRYLRALMSGGTFASEAALVLGDMEIPDLCANVRGGGAARLEDPLRSVGNAVVDMGADEFTVGRPHPMIDYSLRVARIAEEARDPQTAVVLLDVVLGYGAHRDPASELEGVVRDVSSRVCVVCSVTGTERDPQVRSVVERRLRSAGASVMPSNEAAAGLAGEVVRMLGER